MIFHKKICLLVLAASLSAFISTAEAKTILLVPQDDRPVSLDYTVSTAKKAGYTVLTPPRAYLSGKNFRGSPDQLWRWVEQNMVRANTACAFKANSTSEPVAKITACASPAAACNT